MVAITHNGFGRHPNTDSRESDTIPPQRSCPLTPTASDCLSVTSDSDGLNSSVASELAPVRRDPALLIERLENSISRRRMGKRKMRRALNDAALAALVEGHEEVPSLVMRPYHSAFQQLLQSPTNMMVWYHFTNLSEEDQMLFLAGPKQRARVVGEQLSGDKSARLTVAATKPAYGTEPVVDGRRVHPAALATTRRAAHAQGLGKDEPAAILLDPLLGVSAHRDSSDPSKHVTVPSGQCSSRSAAAEATGLNSSSGMMTVGGESAQQSTAGEPHHLKDCKPPTDTELCRMSSLSRDPAAKPCSDIKPLPAECDMSELDISQSSNSSFEVLEDSDTDPETEEFLLLGQ